MISFPLLYVTFPFLAVIGIWVIYAFVNIVHTLKYGYINYISYFMTFILVGASVIILFETSQLLIDVDWSTIISL